MHEGGFNGLEGLRVVMRRLCRRIITGNLNATTIADWRRWPMPFRGRWAPACRAARRAIMWRTARPVRRQAAVKDRKPARAWFCHLCRGGG